MNSFPPMISFVIYGPAQPQGSQKAFVPKGWQRAIITTDNSKLKPWRQEVAVMAKLAMEQAKAKIIERREPVKLVVIFFFDKPKSEKKATVYKATTPDLDKLLRALGDALQGIVYHNDSQICYVEIRKVFGSPARTQVEVWRL